MSGDYLNIANSSFLFLWGGIILAVILVQAVLFVRLAWKEGLRLGLTNKQMLKGLRAGMISAVIPSIPIVITLMAMAPVLGIAFPWIRLSVIGSGPYELLAAGIGAEAMGVDGIGGSGYTAQVFINSVWVMTVGAMWSGLIVVLFTKRIQKGYRKFAERDSRWMSLVASAAFFGVVCVFMAEPIIKGGLALVALATGAVLMTLCAVAVVKLKMTWLKEFALAISMVGAMTGAVIAALL